MITSSDVTNARFTTTKFREGYSIDGVDDFLGVVATRLQGLESRTATTGLSAEDVINVRFTPTKFRAGYDQDQVDNFLDEIVAALRSHGQ